MQPGTINNPPVTFTKADWEWWTAASTNNPTLEQNIIGEVYNYANTTTSGAPFPDLYGGPTLRYVTRVALWA